MSRTHPDEVQDQIEELRASRARVMAMAYGERRDIERRLHDGVQQDLVALAVNLQQAEEVAGSDLAALARRLAEMRQDVRDAIESVRALARRVYPPLLADLGLAAAFRGAASGIGIPVRIEADAERYPADIEATVFFCCLETLESMAETRPAGLATVRVWAEHGSLMFEVAVEGIPTTNALTVPDSVRTGIDDRVGAVGGTLSVAETSDRGHIRGTIPLGAPGPR